MFYNKILLLFFQHFDQFRSEPWPRYNLFGRSTWLATIQNYFEPCLANIFLSINNMFAVSLRTKIWVKTFLTVSGFSFGPKLEIIYGVLCFCSDTDFIFFFTGTNFFLGFLTKQQNSWKWFSELFVSSWDSCFKGKLIGKKICILISDCVKMSSLTS